MKIPQLKHLPALALGILSMASTSQAILISSTADLPPAGVYLSTDIHQLYTGPALEFLLTLPMHAPIAAEVGRRGGGQGSPGTPADEIEIFGSNLDAQLDAHTLGGAPVYTGPVHGSGGFGSVETIVFGKIGNVTGTFATEMLSLNLQGTVPGLGAFMIRESPTRQSTGQVTITPLPGGQFQIDSFFDVFTELSTDGGATWMPGTQVRGGPAYAGHVTLEGVPEPSSITLLATGLITAMGFVRRRR